VHGTNAITKHLSLLTNKNYFFGKIQRIINSENSDIRFETGYNPIWVTKRLSGYRAQKTVV